MPTVTENPVAQTETVKSETKPAVKKTPAAKPSKAAKKAPAKGAKKAPAKKASKNGEAKKRQPSPFLSGSGTQMPWNEENKAIVKALAGTKSGNGKTVAEIAKSSKLEEARVIHYTYHGVKGGIIGAEKMEDETARRFYLTADGRKINLDKVNV